MTDTDKDQRITVALVRLLSTYIEEYTVIIKSPPKDFVRTDIAQTRKRLGIVD